MPHIILEYSQNIVDIDFKALFSELKDDRESKYETGKKNKNPNHTAS